MNLIIFSIFLAQTSLAFGPDLNEAQIGFSEALQQRQENQKQAIKEKIREETAKAQEIQKGLYALDEQAQRVRRMMQGDASKLSQAAQTLALDMAALLNEMTQASGRVSRLAQGLREDTELFYLASELSGLGLEVQKKSQEIADQACLTVVQPLRRRRMKDEANRLSSMAPALADAGIRLSEETDRLSDLVHGRRSGPRQDPSRRRRNFCDPTEIWP